MKNFESVIAFGDSHTSGCELIEDDAIVEQVLSGKIGIDFAEDDTKKLAFPQLVADQLNIPCYNFAMSGGSNDRSFRLLPKIVSENPNSLVLFCYTAIERFEFYYPDEGYFIGRDATDYQQVGLQWYSNFFDPLGKPCKFMNPINQLYVENFMRVNEKENSRIMNMMVYTQSLCNSHALDLKHIFLCPDLIRYENYSTWNLVDKTKILSFGGHSNCGYGSYLEWCENQNYKKLTFGHYDKQAHIELATKILETL
jgi:hypothetical protein